MYRSRNVKCGDCKNVFRAEYDSRKDSQNKYACKCGRLSGYLNSNGSFISNLSGTFEYMSYKEQENTITYYEEDYIRLSDEANMLMSEIIESGEYINKNISGVIFYNFTNKSEVSFELNGGSDWDGLSIKACIGLIDNNGFGWKYGKEKREDRLIESLTRFRDVAIKVQGGELDLAKPKSIWQNEDLEWNDCSRTQLEVYDYELYC